AAIAGERPIDRHRSSGGRHLQRARRRSDRTRCRVERAVHFPETRALQADGGWIAMIRRLLGILGRRTTLAFGLVTFLVGALLATVNITSRYALKVYVDDQLRRIPWDLAVYQQGAVGNDRSLAGHIARASGVTRVESLAFLRARFPEGGEVEAQVDRKPFTTPWLCLLAASDPSILPPELSFALEHGSTGSSQAGGPGGAGRGVLREPQDGPR